MAAATVDMNQKIISMNLDIIEEQRGHMHCVVDQYVDKMIDAARQWVTRGERRQSTFLEILKTISKAMTFLSIKNDEMKSELESETSDLIGRDEFTQQNKNAQMDSAGKPASTRGKSKEDVKKFHTFSNPKVENDQLEDKLNMKLNNLREDTEILKSDVGTFNQYVETGKALLKDYSQKLESLENTVFCLSGNVNELYSDQQILVDRINSHMSDKNDQVISDLSAKVYQITTDLADKIDQVYRELSAKVGHINTEMTDKVDQVNKDLSVKVDLINEELSDNIDGINTDLSGKVEQINTALSVKVDQINVVFQSLTNSEKEQEAQKSKIIDLEKHFNTIEEDTKNNDKKVQQRLDEMGEKIFAVTQKLTVLSKELAKCAKKSDLGAVGFSAERKFPIDIKTSVVGMFEPPTLIAGCQFNSDTGMFTAPSEGIYLAYVSMYLYEGGHSGIFLIREYTRCQRDTFNSEEVNCLVRTDKKNATLCSLDIFKMEVGDKLFIRTSEHPAVSCRIQFTCFKIG